MIRAYFKTFALWINACLYKISEQQIDFHRSRQIGLRKLELQGGPDADYFRSFRLDLSAREYRVRLWQRKLREQRVRLHQL